MTADRGIMHKQFIMMSLTVTMTDPGAKVPAWSSGAGQTQVDTVFLAVDRSPGPREMPGLHNTVGIRLGAVTPLARCQS